VELATIAQRIEQSLGLDVRPVALTFVDSPPEGMQRLDKAMPSACSFWRDAEKGTFYASAAEHYNCPIGSMVMGFEMPEEVQQRLGELVTGMCEQRYLRPDEPPAIPTMKTAHAGIVYGPLAEASDVPDVALVWVTPRQAMYVNEAMGTAAWTAGAPATTGRPGCAALPLAIAEGSPSISLGCEGMRTFTRVADDRMLIALPGNSLDSFVEALEEIGRANDHMRAFYNEQLEKVSGGQATSG
jgi:uncharacterized protein (DUF169 family)